MFYKGVEISIAIDSIGEGWIDQEITAKAYADHLRDTLEDIGYTDLTVTVGYTRGIVRIHGGTVTEELSLKETCDEIWEEWVCSHDSVQYQIIVTST